MLLVDTLYDIARPQIHGDGVPAGSDFVMETLDLGEGGLEPVPLGFVLLTANGFGDGVFESAIVGPELKFLEGWAACKELGYGLVMGIDEVRLEMDSSYVKYAAYKGFLLFIKRDAARGFYVGVFDVEVVWCWRYQQCER